MKIVQTLILPEIKSPITSSLGFLSPEFNWMSWTLSCLQLKCIYPDVELYTNETGKKVLIEILKLPYTKVHVVNDCGVDPKWFSFYKLRTYSLQQEPFIHVDGDVFIWDRLNSTDNKEELIVQNIECIDEHYRQIYKDLDKQTIKLPPVIEREINGSDSLISFNAGIIGGTDIAFFKDYCRQAMDLFKLNSDKIGPNLSAGLNFIAEQHLFYCLAKQKNKPVHCTIQKKVTDVTYFGFANFSEVPYLTKYIHLLGMYKMNPLTCISLAKRLRQDYPDYYYRVISECQNANINMFLSYYNKESTQPDGSLTIEKDIYWKNKYESEKHQHLLVESAFSNLADFFAVKFYAADIKKITKANNEGELTGYYLVPCSYTKTYTEIACDDLEEIIINLLHEPKNILSIIKEIEPYFDEEEINKNRDALVDLIKMKLHAGCGRNIYLIVG